MIRMLLHLLGHDYAAPLRRTLALMTATAVAEGLSYAFLVPLLRALFGDSPEDGRPWLIAFALAVVVYAILRYRSDLAGFRVGTALLHGVYHRLGDHLARLPIGWFTARRVGEVSELAGAGVLQSMGVIAHILGPFLSACVTPLTIVLVMLAYQWQLGLAALLAAPVVVLIQIRTGRAMAATDADRDERDREATARVIEYLRAQPVLRAGGRTAERFGLLDDALSEVARASRNSIRAAVPGLLGSALTVQAVFTALLALGAYLAVGGSIGAAEVLAILVLAARSADPLLSLSDIGSQLRSGRAVLTKIDAVLRTEPLPEPRTPLSPAGHDVEFDAVTFRRGGRPVVRDLSLTVPMGTRLAIVGPSGSGKSTLLQLLARFYDVDGGAVRIGGVDVRSMSTDDLMSRIAIVFQDVYLFDGTIAENIRLGRPGATEAEVRAAASAAQLDEVIERLADGWNTQVGEGGSLLSGGERQRVSIARALLKDTPIVLLDEVTSALDPMNEGAVHAGVDRLMTGRTVVVVAHRLRTVRSADHIVFLDGGRVVEAGSHDELVCGGGRYAEFWRVAMAPELDRAG
ncbi:ABC transporter ATP-binding protein [Nocardia sp. NPDC057668]|uniref:ABC transporter ATP-binding protein n=1 Tax=Nocardia sp. NPDC057668 TaxID=3346202 RepID=UPI00366B4F5B